MVKGYRVCGSFYVQILMETKITCQNKERKIIAITCVILLEVLCLNYRIVNVFHN